MNVLEQRRHRTLWLMVGSEVAALAFVLGAAWLANSLTLWANVLRVGLELPASFFALYVSGRMLRRRAECFDYGLGKWENLASLINVPLMIVGLAFLALRAVQAFLNPQPIHDAGPGLAVLAVFACVNIAFTLRFERLRREAASPLVDAQFILYRNAAIASGFSLATLLTAIQCGVLGAYLDIFGAAALAIFLVQGAVALLRPSLAALLDEAVAQSLQVRIRGCLQETASDYHCLRLLRTRRAGQRIFMEIFLEFDPDMSVRELTRRCARIRRKIESEVPDSEAVIIPWDG